MPCSSAPYATEHLTRTHSRDIHIRSTGLPKGVSTRRIPCSCDAGFASARIEGTTSFHGFPWRTRRVTYGYLLADFCFGVPCRSPRHMVAERSQRPIGAEGATFSVSAPTFMSDLLVVHESRHASIDSLRTFVLGRARYRVRWSNARRCALE